MHILFLPTYLGGTFYHLLDISERNFIPRWGGGDVRAPSAPLLSTRLLKFTSCSNAIMVVIGRAHCSIIYMVWSMSV